MKLKAGLMAHLGGKIIEEDNVVESKQTLIVSINQIQPAALI